MATPQEIDEFNTRFTKCVRSFVPLLYLPGCPVKYSIDDQNHAKVPVEWGEYKRALIDAALADLVRELWRVGAETVGCCEDIGGNGAYIQFLSRFQGGTGFVALLDYLKIPREVQQTPTDFTLGGDGPDQWGLVRFHTWIVRFPRNAIAMLTEAMQAQQPSSR